VLDIHPESDADPRAGTSPAPTTVEIADSDDTTIIRLQSKQVAELFLTPMVAIVLQTVIEERQSQVCITLNIVHRYRLKLSPDLFTGFRAR
jgi:hypothetical protein